MKPSRLHTLGRALGVPWAAAPVASAIALVLSLALGTLPAIGAYLARALLDELARGGTHVTAIAIATAATASLGAGAYFASRYVEGIVHARTTVYVEQRLFAKIISLQQLAYFEDPAFHRELVLAAEASRTAPQALAVAVESVLRGIVGVAALAGVVMVVWPPMAVLLAGLAALGFVAQLARVRHEVQLAAQLVHGYRWYSAYHQLLVDPRAAKEIRLFGATGTLRDRMIERLEANTRGELAKQRIGMGAQILISLAGAAISVVGTVIVARRVAAGELGIGDVVLFTAAVAGIQGAIGGIVSHVGQVGTALELFRGYVALVDQPSREPGGSREVPPLRTAIELRDVWFRYTPESPWVLRGVDMVIRAGDATGIVGVNGSGKSTLVKLLGRFYDVERGQILWDGVDLRELDPVSLRRQLAATFQDFMTYELTAGENIGIGDVDAERIQIHEAALLAGVADVITQLPSGYDTLLSSTISTDPDSPHGQVAALSGGQWQRIAIARTLVRAEAGVVVLDEPCSGLDAEAEAQLDSMIARRFAGKTRILISHRLSAMRHADQIAVLSDGAIVERGTHDELMSRRGSYATWFALQAGAYQDARVQA